MTWTLLHARPDGSFVVRRDGWPYHVTSSDPLFSEVQAAAVGADLPAEPQPEPISGPAVLTRRQLRLGLLGLGITSAQVEAVIADLDEPGRSVALIEWQDATTYERAHPLVEQIGTALGLTVAQLDAAWAGAALL